MRRRGIIFVSVLFVAVTSLMFLGGAMALNPMQAFQARTEGDRSLARQAARGGLDYAILKIRQNPRWRGDGDSTNENGLTVTEDAGDVEGTYQGARFHLNFNDSSVNNLRSGSDTQAPDGHLVPARTVWLVVEGQHNHTRVVIRAGLRPGGSGTPSEDAVAMANNGITAMLPTGSGNVSLSSSLSGVPTKLRSNQGLTVTNGGPKNLVSTEAKAHYLTTYSATASNVDAVQDTGPGAFYRLAYGDLRPPSASGGTLTAGTYVAWQDGTLHYYDMSLAKYKAHIAATPGDPGLASPPLPAGMTYENFHFTVKDDVQVAGTTETRDLAIIPRSGAAEKEGEAGAGGGAVAASDLSAAMNGDPNSLVYAGGGASSFTFKSDELKSVWGKVNKWAHDQGGGIDAMTTPDEYHAIISGTNFDISGTTIQVNNSVSWPVTSGYLADYIHRWAVATDSFGDPDFVALSSLLSVPGAGVPGLIPNSGGDTLTAKDLTVNFAPENSDRFAVLAGAGNVTLGSGLEGQGGSLTSPQDIKVVGMGVNLAANENAQQGVSLYAGGNIDINTFQQTGVDGTKIVGAYRNLDLKGMVYACGDFVARLGDPNSDATWGKAALQGCLVAYGSDPSLGPPNPSSGKGAIRLTAAEASLRFNPAYLQDLLVDPPLEGSIGKFFWDER